MSYKHYNPAREAELPFDSGVQRAIYLEACTLADNKGIVRTGQTELAQVTLFSPATIAKEFKRLLELGLLMREAQGRYRVTIKPEEGRETKAAGGQAENIELVQKLR